MNRLMMTGISTAILAGTASGVLAMTPAGAATARNATAQVSTAQFTCASSHKNYPYPKAPRTFRAWSAGWVTIAPAGRHALKVVKVRAAAGWHARIDTRRGDSVDVYFRRNRKMVKFEAEVNDGGRLTILISNCDD